MSFLLNILVEPKKKLVVNRRIFNNFVLHRFCTPTLYSYLSETEFQQRYSVVLNFVLQLCTPTYRRPNSNKDIRLYSTLYSNFVLLLIGDQIPTKIFGCTQLCTPTLYSYLSETKFQQGYSVVLNFVLQLCTPTYRRPNSNKDIRLYSTLYSNFVLLLIGDQIPTKIFGCTQLCTPTLYSYLSETYRRPNSNKDIRLYST